jgi:thioredoxin reductase
MRYDIAVIGGGPSGIAAAIQLKRYGLEPVLFEGGHLGGLLYNANLIENYPGFPGGISGAELVEQMTDQLAKFDIKLIWERVLSLDYDQSDDCFLIKTTEFESSVSIAIVATGTIPKKIDIFEALPENLKKRTFYEIRTLLKLSGKAIVIVGGGDAAFDYALTLAAKNSVTILNRSDKISALPLLKKRVDANKKISYYDRSILTTIEETDENKMLVKFSHQDKEQSLAADYLVAAVGREPQIEFYSENLIKREKELIDRERLFKIGDVGNGLYRQVSIAVGDGVRAAIIIYHRLKEDKIENN